MSKLILLSMAVSMAVGWFGKAMVRLPVGESSIVFILGTSILATALVVVLYLRRELKLQRERHKDRRAEYGASRKVQALSEDEYAVFQRRVMRSLDVSDRKRLIFQVTQNTLLVLAGLLPMMSTLVDENRTQKLLSFGASLAAFLVGLFSMTKFTVEHRRAGFLIEKALNEWLVGNGSYAGLTSANAFRELVKEVQIILDTSETSFVGAGSAPIVQSGEAVEGLPITNMEIAEALTDEFKETRTASKTPIAESAPAAAAKPDRLPAISQMAVADAGMPESLPRFTKVAPKDFAAWQSAALAANDDDDLITQG